MPDLPTLPNPFDNDIVVDPDNAAPVDVPRIHDGAFALCKSAYERVAAGGGSWSVFLNGSAGCGKTHLLSRLRRWLKGELGAQPPRPAALFVAVRMETSRGMLWRHLRRRFGEELSRTRTDGTTNLDAIVEAYGARFGGNVVRAFEAKPICDCSEGLIQVLEAYAQDKHRRLCRAWLKGDRLSDAQLQLLDLAQSPTDGLEDDLAEDEARQVVGAITRIAAPSPVVFCFDQLEALGLSGETDNYPFFCRMGANLVDTTTNSLLISTVNADFLPGMVSVSNQADLHRIRKEQYDLHLLDLSLGKELIAARLALVPEAASANPIDNAALATYFQAHQDRVTPRKLIHEARRLFATWQNKPVTPALSIDAFLAAEYERLWSASPARREPTDTDAVLAHGLPIALQLLGKDPKEKPTALINLAAGHGPAPVQIAFGNHANATSLARWLAKIQPHAGSQLCIIRDGRLGISKTAKATHQRLDAIGQAGGRIVRVDAEALAALDAMRRLLAVATSGDLSLDGDTVDGLTVRDWLKRNLPKQVTDFTTELLGEEGTAEPAGELDALLELVQRRYIVPVGEAVGLTDVPADRIKAFAGQHPDRICYFGGAHPVVGLAVSSSA
jgi:hypothetical protein